MFFQKSLNFLAFSVLLIAFWFCKPEEEIISNDKNIKLSFSQDSVKFDTLFSTLGSTTKRFYVRNNSKNAVKVNISIGSGENSPYKVIAGGRTGNLLSDVEILGKDSVLVLVSVTIDPSNKDLPFLVKDSLIFNTNDNIQDVKLVAWGRDAIFVNKTTLTTNTTWNSPRPYVILDTLIVDSIATLTIEKGTELYFNNKAALIVRGTLKATGEYQKQIIFNSIRNDRRYLNTAGQWAGIYFEKSSKNNVMNYTKVRNASYGLYLECFDDDTFPDLTLSNSIIENMVHTGLYTISSDVTAHNLIISHCRENLVNNVGGGAFNYTHCTFASFSDFSIYYDVIPKTAVYFSSAYKNAELPEVAEIKHPLYVNIANSIIWGESSSSYFNLDTAENVVYDISNNLIKADLSILKNNNNILTKEAVGFKFKDPKKYNFKLDTLSIAKDKGKITEILSDIENKIRDDKPDLGAYEY